MSDTHRPEAGHELVRARLSALLDDDLEADEQVEVQAHLRRCPACRALLGDLERIRKQARALPPCEPEPDLWPGIRAAMGSSVSGRSGSQGSGFAPAERASGLVDVAPDRDLDGVRAGDGARKGSTPRTATVSGARRGLFLTLPQLAAAALVVLAIGVSGGWWLAPVASAGSPSATSSAAIDATRAPSSGEGDAGPAVADGEGMPAALPAEARALGDEAEALRADFQERSSALGGRTVRTVADNLSVIDRSIREAETAYARSPESAFLQRHVVESYRRKVAYLRDAVAVTSWSADG